MADNREDDLDDLLDDALNDFDKLEVPHSAVNVNGGGNSGNNASSKQNSSSSQPETPQSAAASEGSGSAPVSEEELAKHFANSMKNIMKEFKDDPNLSALLEGLEKGVDSAAQPSSSSSTSTSSSAQEEELNKKINEALEQLAQNADKASGGMNMDPADMDKFFEQFENNPEMSEIMDSMMKQVMSKDILYEPLKELRDVFPGWLEKRRETLSAEELKRHQHQIQLLNQLVATYESEGDSNLAKVTILMQQMQETGPFPNDLMKEMAPGMAFGEDGMPILPPVDGMDPKNCSIM